MKRALVVGIDDYPTMPLRGCVNDATAVANILEKNGDGSPNFAVRLLSSDRMQVTTALLHDALDDLFKGDADTALFFFAGQVSSTRPQTPVTSSRKTDRGQRGARP